MNSTWSLAAILMALLVGAASPGPSFILVSKIAVTQARQAGLAAAMGMGIGGSLFSGLALLGLTALLREVEWLYLALKILGGLYLLYVAVRIWMHAAVPPSASLADRKAGTGGTLWRAFGIGLLTQVSNPKTGLVYGSIFAALLPVAPPTWVIVVLPGLVFLVEAGWYSVVALVFSAHRPRSIYLRAKQWIDRVAAVLVGAIGARLIFDAAFHQKL
jgi:threonine/homoserine/homoserine lactone efflux protein